MVRLLKVILPCIFLASPDILLADTFLAVCEEQLRAEGPQSMALQNQIPDPSEVIVELGEARDAVVPTGKPLQMLVWNIYKAKRSNLISDLLSFSRDVHFAVLQEAIWNRQMANEFIKAPGYGWQYALSFFQRNGDGTGVATGSVFNTNGVVYVRSRGREPIINTPKMAIITEYPIEGRTHSLLVANIHALNFVTNSRFRAQLEDLAQALRHHKGPMIVTGDFNTHHNDRFLIMAKFGENLGMRVQPLRNDRRFLKLDHVLVRGVQVLDAEVLHEIRSSDHAPVLVKFRI